MRGIIIVALLLLAIAASALQSGESIVLRATAVASPIIPDSYFGDFPVYIVDASTDQPRSELYLGEYFYLVFDLRQFSGSLYVRISAGGNVIAEGTVRGGYAYRLPMKIVPPINQGQTYTSSSAYMTRTPGNISAPRPPVTWRNTAPVWRSPTWRGQVSYTGGGPTSP